MNNESLQLDKDSASQQERSISSQALPLCCPMMDDFLATAHPRVFLPIEKTGKAICPYCGTRYFLES